MNPQGGRGEGERARPRGVPAASRPARRWAAIVLLAGVAAICVALGNWQRGRAAQKIAVAESIAAGGAQPVLPLDAGTRASALHAWRPARAHGQWLESRTVLVDNRSHAGRPGFWVVTPLALGDGVGVLVLRGWLPRPLPDAPIHAEAFPATPGEVSGTLLARVPRLFELPAWAGGARPGSAPEAGPAGGLPRIQNADPGTLGPWMGLTLLPVVLRQDGEAGDGLLRDWAPPPLDADTHRGYALQWFSFAAIAALACGVLLVQLVRSSRR